MAVASQPRRPGHEHRCAYCGAKTRNKVACQAHADLPRLETMAASAGWYTPYVTVRAVA